MTIKTQQTIEHKMDIGSRGGDGLVVKGPITII